MTIQSVKRALDILSLFTPAQPSLGITEMSRLLGLAKPTIHGLVQTLADEGFLSQSDETRKYALGLRVYELGTCVISHLRVNQIGGAAVQRLARQTSLMSRIAIWDRDMVLVTLNRFPHDQCPPFTNLGPKVPAYCSAVGKAMLSTLPAEALATYFSQTRLVPLTPKTLTDEKALRDELTRARGLGYACESEEYIMGLACISAPLFDHSGRACAAISVSGAPELLEREEMPAIATDVMRTAGEISFALGFTPDQSPSNSHMA
ncbi:IclR family transcriptional regulator [Desulfoluna spongiiphila]|uniref:Transcriptional regulator, IclR family n=1 Tax=Desulfoluna spongiiphila TaxID=419481 RepID=A0A1G5JEN6_9BACT|nr:IclR family transcriptional regulator [Desulfoluna spongiiphila]SCY86747.1 transcriptional regulator, IclR family [Desulfoluna spongiiphila]VVS93112.1 transcription regulator iclr c-terminal [Desulfoluna spongiiphila]